MNLQNVLIASGLAIFVAACGSTEMERTYPESVDQGEVYQRGERPAGIFGDSGIRLFGGGGSEERSASPGIGVNPFLWRASLDTVSFMPLAQADPFGGVIITEWHQPDGVQNERLKINLFILGRELRSDGLRASVFRQVRDGENGWVDAEVEPGTATELENAILSRARQLRVAQSR